MVAERKRRKRAGDGAGAPALLATAQALATAMAKSPRTIARWRNNPTMPGGHAGPWDPAAVASWAKQKTSRNRRRSLPAAEDRQLQPDVADRQAFQGSNEAQDVATLATADPQSAEFRRVQISYRKVKLASALLQLEQDKRELVKASKVRGFIRARASEIRTAFRNFGRRHAAKLLGCKTQRAVDQLWTKHMDETLRAFIRDQGYGELVDDD